MTIKMVDLSKIEFTPELVERFWSHVSCDDVQGDGCWNWTGVLKDNGYGRVLLMVDGRRRLVSAHRVAVALDRLDLLMMPGMVCDHLCRNRKCVRPSHIRVVSQAENLYADGSQSLAKKNGEKAKCPAGHDFVWVKAKDRPSGKKRRCPVCHSGKQKMRRIER